jgi:hypothetical protein
MSSPRIQLCVFPGNKAGLSLASAKPVELWLGGKLFSDSVASFKLPAISSGSAGDRFKNERHWKAFV